MSKTNWNIKFSGRFGSNLQRNNSFFTEIIFLSLGLVEWGKESKQNRWFLIEFHTIFYVIQGVVIYNMEDLPLVAI